MAENVMFWRASLDHRLSVFCFLSVVCSPFWDNFLYAVGLAKFMSHCQLYFGFILDSRFSVDLEY